jgi:hypothetical protein
VQEPVVRLANGFTTTAREKKVRGCHAWVFRASISWIWSTWLTTFAPNATHFKAM